MKKLIVSSIVGLGLVASAGAFAAAVNFQCSQGKQTVHVSSGQQTFDTQSQSVSVFCAGKDTGGVSQPPMINVSLYSCDTVGGTIHVSHMDPSLLYDVTDVRLFCAANTNVFK